MAESALHIELVKAMYKWVCIAYFNGDDGLVLVSLPSTPVHSKPLRVLGGYEPDLFAKDLSSNLLILGEAKTSEDIGRLHSKEQYRAYYETCKYHNGPSILVFAVPFFDVPRMRSTIRATCGPTSENLRIEVIGF